MLAAAGILVVCLVITRSVHYRAAAQPRHFHSGPPAAPLAKTGGLELVRRDRYLLLIAVLIVLLNVVNTSGEILLSKFVIAESVRVAGADMRSQEKFIGEFYAHFYSWVNLVGLLVQMFGVSRIFRYIGVRGALFVLPCIALANYSVLAFLPILLIVRIGKILENSTDYSLMNTTRHALFLPTSREAKYKAKSAIDTFVVRTGDVLTAGVVKVGTVLRIGIAGFAAVNLVLAVVWLGVVVAIGRLHRERAAAAAPAGAPA
jgi:AAA family ATP:ADP antiporter